MEIDGADDAESKLDLLASNSTSTIYNHHLYSKISNAVTCRSSPSDFDKALSRTVILIITVVPLLGALVCGVFIMFGKNEGGELEEGSDSEATEDDESGAENSSRTIRGKKMLIISENGDMHRAIIDKSGTMFTIPVITDSEQDPLIMAGGANVEEEDSK